MKWSNILLIVGLLALLAGAILSVMKMQPYSDYVLVAGAVLVIFRGAVKNRESEKWQRKGENNETYNNQGYSSRIERFCFHG